MDARPDDLQHSLREYNRLGTIAQNTIKILTQFIAHWYARRDRPAQKTVQQDESAKLTLPGARADWSAAALGATLEHLADIREGFQLQVRASDIPTLAELQYLVERALVDWRWLEDFNWRVEQTAVIEIPRSQMMAFAHAYISLALLPRMPKTQITFPQSRASYADIPVPASGAQLLIRLEELEGVIYRVLGGAIAQVEPEPLRRTYGFFESSAWLIASHQRKFGAA